MSLPATARGYKLPDQGVNVSYSPIHTKVHIFSLCAAFAALAGCGGGNTGQTGSNSSSSGGNGSTGGSSSGSVAGGSISTGGSASGSVTGGSSSGSLTGGSNSTGGSRSGSLTGGSATTGGSNNGTGGSSAKATGGANPTGGTTSTGVVGTGGRSSPTTGGAGTGGSSPNATGGTNQGGSSTNAGGRSATGGTASTAGASSGADATIVPDPSWACGMATGIPSPTLGKLVFHATLQLGTTHDVGATQYGNRRLYDVKGGTLTGDKIQATFLTGGLDLELTLSNGSIELEEIDVLKASDNTLIYLRSCGMAPAGSTSVRVVPDFEVATGSSLAWLNTGKFAGTRTLDATAKTITLDVYDISAVTVGEPRIQITDPSGVPNQPWDCSTTTGTKGTSVFTESVTLGGSQSIGASKRGTRNIIPITGGTVTGRLTGTIVPGGADYQLIGTTTKLDAKYTLASNDGEFVIVRNCGPMGALIPQFETRAAGPYAFLNTNAYLSSDPGSASGGVSITFYDRK